MKKIAPYFAALILMLIMFPSASSAADLIVAKKGDTITVYTLSNIGQPDMTFEVKILINPNRAQLSRFGLPDEAFFMATTPGDHLYNGPLLKELVHSAQLSKDLEKEKEKFAIAAYSSRTYELALYVVTAFAMILLAFLGVAIYKYMSDKLEGKKNKPE